LDQTSQRKHFISGLRLDHFILWAHHVWTGAQELSEKEKTHFKERNKKNSNSLAGHVDHAVFFCKMHLIIRRQKLNMKGMIKKYVL